jgi:outer membrane murein-binding lipoprotein Lpp
LEGVNILKKKLFTLLAGSILSAVMLSGCNNDNKNDIQNPPVPDVNNPVDINYDKDNIDLDNNNNHYPTTEDKNTDTDKDPIKDSNTKQEDIIEDDIDMKDADNKDE